MTVVVSDLSKYLAPLSINWILEALQLIGWKLLANWAAEMSLTCQLNWLATMRAALHCMVNRIDR